MKVTVLWADIADTDTGWQRDSQTQRQTHIRKMRWHKWQLSHITECRYASTTAGIISFNDIWWKWDLPKQKATQPYHQTRAAPLHRVTGVTCDLWAGHKNEIAVTPADMGRQVVRFCNNRLECQRDMKGMLCIIFARNTSQLCAIIFFI